MSKLSIDKGEKLEKVKSTTTSTKNETTTVDLKEQLKPKKPKAITKKVIQEKMADMDVEASQAVNDLYPQLVQNLDELGLLVKDMTSSYLKRVTVLAAAFPMIQVNREELTKKELKLFDLLTSIKDIHIQLAFASVFIKQKEDEAKKAEEKPNASK